MSSSTASIHVIQKDNIANHATIQLPYLASSLSALQDGEVRAKPLIVSLTANNLSYVHGGSTLHWWDGFPVAAELPHPYNDQAQYGVVPVWGYGQVIESKVDELQPGQLLWGFWPSHNLPIVLQLEAAEAEGHYIDKTESRSKMMSLYHRYIAPGLSIDGLTTEKMDSLAWQAVYATGEAGRFISRFIFGSPTIHPLGTQPWSEQDADLTSAVVISMSASGKTARFFQDTLINERPAGTGPRALLAVTASEDRKLIPKASFPTRTVSYSEAVSSETMSWSSQHEPSKVIIIDFGSRGNSLQNLQAALQQSIDARIIVLGVGAEMKAKSPQEVAAFQQGRAAMENRIQMNASGVQDRAIEVMGEKAFFQEYEGAWKGFVERGNLDRMKLEWGEGISGVRGIESGWTRLCNQDVPSDVGLVYRV